MSSQQFEALTEREQEVLVALVDGKSNQQIASQLYLSLNTVKWYNRQIYSKLGVANRQEAVARAENLQLLEPAPNIDDIPHNLTESALPFIGRREEIETLKQLLIHDGKRHVTILGAGGMGKTSLSLEVGRQVLEYFTDGIFLVKLAALNQPTEIPSMIAEALGIHQKSADYEFSLNNITQLLSDKTCLLILDNYEHLLPDGADVITHILQHTSQVSILATSRERLNMGSETLFSMGGLFSPTQSQVDDALEFDAVTLFCQHVRRIRHEFEPTEEDLAHISKVCQLTGGMPLALILAAAWIEVFSLEEIAEEIQQNLDFLSTTLRDIPERQQSIQAIFESTWERLNAAEQTAFMRFSIFIGGCTRDAARAVTGANPRTLMSLLNKSLITHNADTKRYEIHELLRQYAEVKLYQNKLVEDTTDRHAEHYLTYIANQTANLKHGRVALFKDQLIADWGNIFKATLATWGWQAEQGDLMVHVAIAIVIFYEDVRPIPLGTERVLQMQENLNTLGIPLHHPIWSYYVENVVSKPDIIQLLEDSKDLKEDTYLGFGYIRVSFWLFSHSDEASLADTCIENAITIFEQVGDDFWLGHALLHASFSPNYVPDPEKSYRERALEHFQRLNNPIKIAHAYTELALEFAYMKDDLELGRYYAELALEKALESGIMLQIMQARTQLSWLLFSFGEAEAIRQHAEACIAHNAGYVHDVVRVLPYVQLSFVTSFVDEDYESALALSKKAESLQTHWSGEAHQGSTTLALLGLGRTSEAFQIMQEMYNAHHRFKNFMPLLYVFILFWHYNQYEHAAELFGFVFAQYPYAKSDIGWQWSVLKTAISEIEAALGDDTFKAACERYADTPYDDMMLYIMALFEALE